MMLDVTVATKFLEDIFGDCPDDEWISVWAIDRTLDPSKRASQKVLWEQVNHIDWLVKRLAGISKTHCIFFGVATRKEHLRQGRGGDDDCVRLPALFADIDVTSPNHVAQNYPPNEEAVKEIMKNLPTPSLLVATGGGYHAYWKLNPPLVGPEAQVALRKWGNYVMSCAEELDYKLDDVFQISRILRLAGTLNVKNIQIPQPVKIVSL
jgi:hypothetical protein